MLNVLSQPAHCESLSLNASFKATLPLYWVCIYSTPTCCISSTLRAMLSKEMNFLLRHLSTLQWPWGWTQARNTRIMPRGVGRGICFLLDVCPWKDDESDHAYVLPLSWRHCLVLPRRIHIHSQAVCSSHRRDLKIYIYCISLSYRTSLTSWATLFIFKPIGSNQDSWTGFHST